jgi:type III secretion protein J
LKEEGGNEPTYMVKVAKADFRQASKLLSQYSLPRPKAPGLDLFVKNKGMIPTQTEERAMLILALGGEVSQALQKVEGILEARTIVNMPENNDLTQPEKKPISSVSVLVKCRYTVDGKPPVSDGELRKFVAAALPEVRPENVAVLFTQAVLPGQDANAGDRTQEVLGFQMTKASADSFRIAAGITALIVLALAGFTVFSFMRSAQQPKPRQRPRPEA